MLTFLILPTVMKWILLLFIFMFTEDEVEKKKHFKALIYCVNIVTPQASHFLYI